MNAGAALSRALLVTLATPASWPLALATFFLRGGLLLVVLPIVVLPSPVGLGNLLAPVLMTVVFGGPTIEIAAFVFLAALALVAWVVVGGLVAATLEADSARLVAGDEALPAVARRRTAARILAARLLAHAPTGIALIWASFRFLEVAYRELTSPDDVALPIVLRVLAGAPDAAAALVVSWSMGEVLGGLAARRIAMDELGAGSALRDAIVAVARHPLGAAAGFVVPLAGLVLVLAPSTLAATVAWSAVRVTLRSAEAPVLGTLAVLLFVSLWIVGLLLIAVTAAWRAAVWSIAQAAWWPHESHRSPAGPG